MIFFPLFQLFDLLLQNPWFLWISGKKSVIQILSVSEKSLQQRRLETTVSTVTGCIFAMLLLFCNHWMFIKGFEE